MTQQEHPLPSHLSRNSQVISAVAKIPWYIPPQISCVHSTILCQFLVCENTARKGDSDITENLLAFSTNPLSSYIYLKYYTYKDDLLYNKNTIPLVHKNNKLNMKQKVKCGVLAGSTYWYLSSTTHFTKDSRAIEFYESSQLAFLLLQKVWLFSVTQEAFI